MWSGSNSGLQEDIQCASFGFYIFIFAFLMLLLMSPSINNNILYTTQPCLGFQGCFARHLKYMYNQLILCLTTLGLNDSFHPPRHAFQELVKVILLYAVPCSKQGLVDCCLGPFRSS